MSVRPLFCDSCFVQGDFREFVTCPLCRKTLCRRCTAEGPPTAGKCAKRVPCGDLQAQPEPVPVAKPTGLAGLASRLRRLFRVGPQ